MGDCLCFDLLSRPSTQPAPRRWATAMTTTPCLQNSTASRLLPCATRHPLLLCGCDRPPPGADAPDRDGGCGPSRGSAVPPRGAAARGHQADPSSAQSAGTAPAQAKHAPAALSQAAPRASGGAPCGRAGAPGDSGDLGDEIDGLLGDLDVGARARTSPRGGAGGAGSAARAGGERAAVDWVTIGAAEEQGHRPSMEDEHIAEPQFCPVALQGRTAGARALAGVLDGHSGRDVASYAARRLPALLAAEPWYACAARPTEQAVTKSLLSTFDRLDGEILSKAAGNGAPPPRTPPSSLARALRRGSLRRPGRARALRGLACGIISLSLHRPTTAPRVSGALRPSQAPVASRRGPDGSGASMTCSAARSQGGWGDGERGAAGGGYAVRRQPRRRPRRHLAVRLSSSDSRAVSLSLSVSHCLCLSLSPSLPLFRSLSVPPSHFFSLSPRAHTDINQSPLPR